MSDGISFHIEGVEDLLKEIRKLEGRAQKRFLFRGLRAIGKQMVKHAKQNAPVGELNDGFHEKGNLRRSIGMKNLTRLGSYSVAVLVGPRVRGGKYAKGYHGIMVEKGTKAHAIAKRRSKKAYKHKGAKSQEFLKKAYEEVELIAQQEFEKMLRKILYG
ncbi:MAG: HK97 gp10 family phage protein [Immundisolibacteraceae bacterium]|nr:HK97 gp10 family phage protein [Immundisolibacteraceae bacterium]